MLSNDKSEDESNTELSTSTTTDQRGRNVYDRIFPHGEWRQHTKCCKGNIENLSALADLLYSFKYVKTVDKPFREYEGGNAWQCFFENFLSTRKITVRHCQRSANL